MQKAKMELVLKDVRKAYRLLADYQQRIIELLDFMKNELKAEHYYHDRPYHYDSRSIYKMYTDSDAGKNFLPMLDFHVLWHRTKHMNENEEWQNNLKKGDLVFDIFVVDDVICNENIEPENAKSELRIYVYQCVKYTRKNNWFADVWCKFEYPELEEVSKFKDNSGQIEYNIYGESIDLSDLYSEETVRNALNAFRQRAGKALNQKI